MACTLLPLNWLIQKRLIFFMFWYSMVVVLGLAYYLHVHVRWEDNSNLLRVYNSIFLPTSSPLLRQHSALLPQDNVTSLKSLQDMGKLRISELRFEGKLPYFEYQNTKHNFFEVIRRNFSKVLIEPSKQVKNFNHSLSKVRNSLLQTNEIRTATPRIPSGNHIPTNLSQDNNVSPPVNRFHNSTYLIAAIEENMQRIHDETELGLKRLMELIEIINAPNETLVQRGRRESSEPDKFRNTSKAQYLNRSRPHRGLRKTYPSNINQRISAPRWTSRTNFEKGLASLFQGTSILRDYDDKDNKTHSIIRAIADKVKPAFIYRPPTPMPEVDGYYLMETRTKLHIHCKACAVVSNSGQLLNKSAGAEIDSYPCIIRMNNAPVAGFENDVGTRTTARVMGHANLLKLNQSLTDQYQIFVNESTRTNRMIVPWLFNTRVDKKKDKHYSIAKNFSKTYADTQFYMLSSNKMALAEDLFQASTGISRKDAKTWLSTGWMTLLYARDTCDRTDVFGFVHDRFCKENPNDTTPYHYYEANGKKECDYYMQSEKHLTHGHIFVTEKAIFARWAHMYNLHFHYPSWNLTGTTNTLAPLDTPFIRIFREAQHNRMLHSGGRGGNMGGTRRHHMLTSRGKKPLPPIIGPKTKEDMDKDTYQRFTHVVMFIVAIFLSLVVFLLLFLLASLFVFCFYL